MSELARWDNFYVIVGSAAGALIGLQFVVATLLAQGPPIRDPAVGSAFGTPTIVYFSVALFLSAILHAPWDHLATAAGVWGITGFAGLLYAFAVTRTIVKQNLYKPVFEDWLFHAILPFIAYAVLVASALTASTYPRESLFGVAASVLTLLFTGIHNAWDATTYHVFVRRPPANPGDRGGTF